MSISELPVKTLVKVLAKLRGGEIGFDPFRDGRTKTKQALLSFILANHSNQEVISAVSSVESEALELPLAPIDRPATPVTPQAHTPALPPIADPRLAALQALLSPAVDTDTIKRLVKEHFEDENESLRAHYDRLEKAFAARSAPVIVHVMPLGASVARDMGMQHERFADLLKMSQARTRDGHRLNIWLKGPAGSGKTTAAHKVAEALDMPFHFNGAISTEYELMGFKDASGQYHRTAFRDAFENGGVYLFDEVDSSLPKAVLAFNAALANGQCRFPDAMVKRHPDCVILAGANTAGNGATSDYIGRMKQDLAFLNRFVMLDWPLDLQLENSLASNKTWVKRVQALRKNCEKRGIKGHIISPRATFYGEALIAAGLDMATVEAATLRGALSDDQWTALCQ